MSETASELAVVGRAAWGLVLVVRTAKSQDGRVRMRGYGGVGWCEMGDRGLGGVGGSMAERRGRTGAGSGTSGGGVLDDRTRDDEFEGGGFRGGGGGLGDEAGEEG